MRSPGRALPLVLAAATGLAACGGGGGGGEEDAYVRTYQDNCTRIQAATRDLTTLAQSTVGGAPDQITKVRTGLTTFLDTSGGAISALADADAPSRYADFQERFERQAEAFTGNLGKARSDVAGLRSAQDLNEVSGILSSLGNVGGAGEAALPDDLKKAAPACAQLFTSGGPGGATG